MTLILSQRRTLLHFLNQSVRFITPGTSSASRNKNATTEPTATDLVSSPKASKQRIRKIKQLHKENKELFGVLLETKQEKVKRIKKESKLLTQITSAESEQRGGVSKKIDAEKEALEGERKKMRNIYEPSYQNPKLLPRTSAVRLEHAGVTVNKNRATRGDAAQESGSTVTETSSASKVRAHKRAEIEWTLKNGPTGIKLFELSSSSPSSTSTTDSDHDADTVCKELVGQGHLDTSLPYYNPDRNQNYEYADENNGGLSGIEVDNLQRGRTNTIITSFPYPFSFHGVKQEDKTPSKLSYPEIRDDVDSSQAILSNKSLEKPIVKLPSVSKILNVTMPEEQAQALRRWEQRMIAQMGVEGFRLYKENILSNGKMLHSNIECYLRGTPSEEIVIAETNQGHWNSLNAVLASIENVHVLESHVMHPLLQYCGVIDCVAEFRNRLVLIDWKTSQKPKPVVSMTYDTPLQIAAYIGAINYDDRYSMKINDGLIVIAYEDGSSCQTFLLGSTDLEKYWKLWLKRLNLFKKMNTTPLQ